MNTAIRTTQISGIEAHLLAGKTITPMEALTVYGTFRLASHIEKLRRVRGMDIDTTLKTDERGKEYAQYSLAPAADAWTNTYFYEGDSVVVRGVPFGLPKFIGKASTSARVLGAYNDVSEVEFTNGKRRLVIDMNNRELRRAA